MITSNLTGLTGELMHMPSVVFMNNRQPFIVDGLELEDGELLEVVVACNGHSYTEARRVHQGRVVFDLSGAMRQLSPDVTDVFSTRSPRVRVTAQLMYGTRTLKTIAFTALYGALDQMEGYHMAPATRRIWMNYPQTLAMWLNDSGKYVVASDEGRPSLVLQNIIQDMTEVDLIDAFRSISDNTADHYLRTLDKGGEVTVLLSSRLVSPITDATTGYWKVRLCADLTPRGSGTYLRWLQRDGSFAYWLFKQGDLQTDAVQRSAFTRYVDGDPLAPVAGQLRNPVQQDMMETRKQVLGTDCRSNEEYYYLCGLACSPVVDRLITVNGVDYWQRVNVVPGGHARSQRYGTPHHQTFELTIELPAHNTVTL